ncbi:Hypothetical protein EUBREC_2890 [Agathobacter rectalis ATCC 33656]|uniref:Uncharacterized protein n=1 Tax=Agathobacter rectalis (strain ATCC 33656 / DSM 3377 / JCM 17463 / KCTC 5835 / VPI 0990) TaxID=515619 RepID=C4ZHY2_AGARV|nr:Hypothetical protein EUBREC_2890 [Agathobacter rectalis ATCC 33656]
MHIQKPNPWECGFGFLKIKIHRWKNHILSLVDFQKKFIYY